MLIFRKRRANVICFQLIQKLHDRSPCTSTSRIR
jgi:hypothetical protein